MNVIKCLRAGKNAVFLGRLEIFGNQEVARSSLVTPASHNFKPNQDLDYLPVFDSEAFSRSAKRYIPLCSLNKFVRRAFPPNTSPSLYRPASI
jgi:hypothetical protein